MRADVSMLPRAAYAAFESRMISPITERPPPACHFATFLRAAQRLFRLSAAAALFYAEKYISPDDMRRAGYYSAPERRHPYRTCRHGGAVRWWRAYAVVRPDYFAPLVRYFFAYIMSGVAATRYSPLRSPRYRRV